MRGKVMPSKLALESSFVFDTSAHVPFPPAVILRYLLAAIDMTVLSAENKVRPGRADPHCGAGALAVNGTNPARSPRGGDTRPDGVAVPVRPGGS
jgi:hypothetical protein